MRTIVIGLGNPILCDDGAGPQVAAELKDLSGRDGISVEVANAAGLVLLDLLVGYDKAIIIDSIKTAGGKAGQIYQLDLNALNKTHHTATAHDFDLVSALQLGKKLDMVLPHQIDIFAIEAKDLSSFAEECTPEVKKAIPVCAGMVRRELDLKKKRSLT
jgi:hydrogenase maturation protease